jgi:hypothetical protein
MTDYEYKQVELPTISRHDTEDLQSILDEEAVNGWRLDETVEVLGETAALIFERERSNA